jgi:VanZ family protein
MHVTPVEEQSAAMLSSVIQTSAVPLSEQATRSLRGAARRRLALSVVLVYSLMLFGGTHWPTVLMPKLPAFLSFDKLCHFTGYGILTLLLLLLPSGFFRQPEGGYRSPAWLAAMLILLLVAAASLLDELTQPLVGRDFEMTDWACDMSGALVALLIVTLGLMYQVFLDQLRAAFWPYRPR